jgi:hypothetical protein
VQPAMIEKQVEIEVLAVDNHPLLPLDEGESIAQLQYKLLQVRHKAILQALLAIHPFQSCELQKIRVQLQATVFVRRFLSGEKNYNPPLSLP